MDNESSKKYLAGVATDREGREFKRIVADVTCTECKKVFRGDYREYIDNGEIIQFTEVCPGCKSHQLYLERVEESNKKLPEEINDVLIGWLCESNIPNSFDDKMLNNFKRELQPTAYDRIKNWNNSSMVLSSPNIYGVGKTHLSCALIHIAFSKAKPAFINEYGFIKHLSCPAYFITEPELLTHIRNTYNGGSNETEADIYDKLSKYKLIVIDDVGKTKPRDYSFLQGVYFNIINSRYNIGKHIVLTTNLSLSDLENHIGGACSDRLVEMCGNDGFIVMAGKSYRRINTLK